MDAKKKIPVSKIIQSAGAALVLAVFIVASALAFGKFGGLIDDALTGKGRRDFDSEEFQQAAAQSSELVKLIAEEGIAMVRNENNALPLVFGENEDKNINVFGWASTDNGFLLRGIGSGSSTIQASKTKTLLTSLREAGFNVNEELISMYESYYRQNFNFSTGNAGRVRIIEPPMSKYSSSLLANAEAFSDIALVTLGRVSGENVGEIPQNQPKSGEGVTTDTTRHFLQISKEEEDLITYCTSTYDKTIVLINTSNQMELGFLEDLNVDACLNVGLMGQNGAQAIPEILLGTVTPSGRLTDTFAYDLTKAPSYQNYLRTGNNIQYVEDLYFGYRYYETADADGVFDTVSNEYGDGYDGVVQYPFGYGLSYTTFEWTLENSNLNNNDVITKNSKIELEFSCTNTGDRPGRDVMQIYASTPYYGDVEKASIQLVDFEKTAIIEPGLTQTGIKFEIDPYYFASFDAYDKNYNGHTTYELDAGNYQIKFMENSHTPKLMSDGVDHLSLKVEHDQIYDTDPVTGNPVTIRMTGSTAYANVPIDGSNAFTNRTAYLSREALLGTAKKMSTSLNSSNISTANNYRATNFDQTTMPTLGANNNLYLKTRLDGSKASQSDLNVVNNSQTKWNEDLVAAIAADYNSVQLQQLIDQLSADEACNIVENGGFGTIPVVSIGKEITYDFDGPAGFNNDTWSLDGRGAGWSAFPNETLVGQTWSKFIAKQYGLAVGLEGKASGVNGWYAPGVNLHRSPFNARNYEYYSEDPILSGYLAAYVVEGARANGVYTFVKHLALSEPGQNARNLNTWLTEQNYREIYLRPFELTVKVGKANGMMTAFNSVGGFWAGACYPQNVDILRNEWGFRGTLITDWSTGDGNMNCYQGVRGGNDIWLNPGTNVSKLSRSNPTEVYCAKQAAKNVVYTICSTYDYAKNYDHSNDIMDATIGTVEVKAGQGWWRPTLIAIDVVIGLGVGTWMAFTWIINPMKKAKVKKELE